MGELQKLRAELSAIDERLMVEFLRRMELIHEVAASKAHTQGAVFVREQEVRVLEKTRAQVPQVMEDYAVTLMGTLMRLSRERQYELLLEQDVNWALGKALAEAESELPAVNTVAIWGSLDGALAQGAKSIYQGASLVLAENSFEACLLVEEGKVDVAVLSWEEAVLSLLEKHALFIQACSDTGFMALGARLVVPRGPSRVSLLIHLPNRVALAAWVFGVLGDLGLQVRVTRPLGDAFYLEFLAEDSSKVRRALYQIEQETEKIRLLGWFPSDLEASALLTQGVVPGRHL